MNPKPRAAVALSGGVDSSTAAVLLQDQGYDVVGINMHLWCEETSGPVNQRRPCCSVESVHQAEHVCALLGIPFYVINLEKEFRKHVVDYFSHEYRQGRTPNPCIACNQHLKFRLLLDKVLSLGIELLATGHYARVIRGDDGYHLLKGTDSKKDQSYFLYTLGQPELQHLLFPVGDYCKADIRSIARARGLPVAHKKESQDLCFVANDYRAFLAGSSSAVPGDIIDPAGNIIGCHKGISNYTIGQRYVSATQSAERLYITRINAEGDTVVVGRQSHLYASRLLATGVHWVNQVPPSPVALHCKIRYKSAEAPAVVVHSHGLAEVVFESPQRAITPGQAIVFYRGDEVLGGATIDSTEPKHEDTRAVQTQLQRGTEAMA